MINRFSFISTKIFIVAVLAVVVQLLAGLLLQVHQALSLAVKITTEYLNLNLMMVNFLEHLPRETPLMYL